MERHLRKQGAGDFGKPRGGERERRALAEMRGAKPMGKGCPGATSVAETTAELQASRSSWGPSVT